MKNINELYLSKNILKNAYNSLKKEEKQALNQKLIISDQVKQNSKRQSSSEMSSKIILPSNINSCGCC